MLQLRLAIIGVKQVLFLQSESIRDTRLQLLLTQQMESIDGRLGEYDQGLVHKLQCQQMQISAPDDAQGLVGPSFLAIESPSVFCFKAQERLAAILSSRKA